MACDSAGETEVLSYLFDQHNRDKEPEPPFSVGNIDLKNELLQISTMFCLLPVILKNKYKTR